jgi:pyruvate dehydrogenase E1 component alpha subunit
MNADTVPDPSDLFEYVYATRTPQLEEQAAMLAAEIAADAAGTGDFS